MAAEDNVELPEGTPVTVESLAFDLAKANRRIEALEDFCYDPWENGQSLVDVVDDLMYVMENPVDEDGEEDEEDEELDAE